MDMSLLVIMVSKWRIKKNLTYFKGYLNDLWKYSNGEWTWVSGNNSANVAGIYGNQGVPSSSNYPGVRQSLVGGIDSFGSFWLFGGFGYDSIGNNGN